MDEVTESRNERGRKKMKEVSEAIIEKEELEI